MSRMSEMCQARQDHCNENYSPEDEFYNLEEMEHRERLIWTCADANCSGEVALSKGLHPSHCPYCQGEAFYPPPQSPQEGETP